MGVLRCCLARSLGLLFVTAWVTTANAEASGPDEYQVKGAFLYNFAKFVEWPAAAMADRSTFEICLLGSDSVAASLDRVVKGRQIEGRAVSVRRRDDLADAGSCHVLYVTGDADPEADVVAEAVAGSATLTVGEKRRFAQAGGMINFVWVDKKVRFEVNRRSVEAAGLAVSSRLLKLAHEVFE